jgi:uncharacterized protein (TIGR00296 family)
MADDDDSPVATAEMCNYCFDVLFKKLRPSHDDDDDDDEVGTIPTKPRRQYTPPNVKCPLFVTWEKCQSPAPPPLLSKVSTSTSGITTPSAYSSATSRASSSIISDDDTSTHNTNSESDSSPPKTATAAAAYDLRGCIGTLAKRNLQQALSEFAITSALHDRRFDPISIHELPMLRVGVSLLVKYELCQDCFDWVVGVHGIIIKFGGNSNKNNNTGTEQYSATYLPEVAKDQSWNQKEAVVSLIRKAGYHGHITNELLSSIHCTRYQSSKFRVSYQEYVMTMHAGKDPLLNSADLMMAAIVAEEMSKKKGNNSKKFCVIM